MREMKHEKIFLVWDDFKQNHMKYLLTNKEIWYKKLEEATLFIEKNKKRPDKTSKNKDEKVLGEWISNQITNHERRLDIMKHAEFTLTILSRLAQEVIQFNNYKEEKNVVPARHS